MQNKKYFREKFLKIFTKSSKNFSISLVSTVQNQKYFWEKILKFFSKKFTIFVKKNLEFFFKKFKIFLIFYTGYSSARAMGLARPINSWNTSVSQGWRSWPNTSLFLFLVSLALLRLFSFLVLLQLSQRKISFFAGIFLFWVTYTT